VHRGITLLALSNRGQVGAVQTGPNAGLNYVISVPAILSRIVVNINNAALSAHSVFWNGQQEDNSNRIIGTACTKSSVTSSLTRARIYEHEGMAFQDGSHTRRFRDAVQELAAPALEGIVGLDGVFGPAWDVAYASLRTAFDARAKRADVDSRVSFGCSFDYTFRRPPPF
jgi:hypothetical protein